MRNVESHLLIVIEKLLTVHISTKLCRKHRVSTQLLESKSGVCALTAGNIGYSTVINEGFTGCGNFKHIHRKINICTADNEYFFVFHFVFSLQV